MARRRRRERVEPSRKEQALTRKERQQQQRILIIVGAALGMAAAVLVIGLVYQLLIVPGSAVAQVEEERISTRDFWHRAQFEQDQTENQLVNLINFQRQVDPTGEQGFFTAQIQQLQGTLANPEGLANQTLEKMIDEAVIRHEAAKAGIPVSSEEIDEALASQIAQQRGGVTAPDATATAEAVAVATPTPTLAPSPTPTITLTSTAILTPTATPLPTPTVYVVSQEDIDQDYRLQIDTLKDGSGLTEAQFRNLIAVSLLNTKLIEQIGDQMPTLGEQVRARHILISVAEDASDADQQEALARAISITQRLRNGEDFAALAEQFSEDPGSAANGGDLGFFGRGRMVPEFEEAAFGLEIGEISDPVRSPFGYHIILVEERNPGDPDFNAWLQDAKAQLNIVRDLTDGRLPELQAVDPALLQPLTAAPPAVPAPEPTDSAS